MQLPQSLLQSLQHTKGFDRQAFEAVHQGGEQVTSIRINPLKPVDHFPNFPEGMTPIPWTPFGFYLPARPSFTFDPLFHAGTYYVQEASSMFLEQALTQCIDLNQPLRVLDLCGSPGGKSTHLQSLISPDSLLVSNEVIRSRANVLKDNMIKWGSENVVVTNNDPSDFSRLSNYFDVIVIDAPCSGSGLFRRDPEAIEEWSENNVALCSQRQQRILADAWPALKKGGLLVYSTCSYSEAEDEEIIEWMVNEFPAEHIRLSITGSSGIIESGGGYRFWPHAVKGEGFFLACFRKTDGDETTSPTTKNKPASLSKAAAEVVAKWIESADRALVRHEDTVYAWPGNLYADFALALDRLRVIYSGVRCGELMRDKLIPDHALAMSRIAAPTIPLIDLPQDKAIHYLQRKDISLEGVDKGWQLVGFQGHPLGWVNVLQNRVNNYYPRELRILKDH